MRQLTDKEITKSAIVIWSVSIILIPILLGFYWLITYITGSSLFPNISTNNTIGLVSTVTSFSITMTGFIAAIGAYILSVSNKPRFNLWRNAGYLALFYHLYAASILFLLVTFSACILMLLSGPTTTWLKIILTLVIVNFVHIALITISAINQTKNATSN